VILGISSATSRQDGSEPARRAAMLPPARKTGAGVLSQPIPLSQLLGGDTDDDEDVAEGDENEEGEDIDGQDEQDEQDYDDDETGDRGDFASLMSYNPME